MSFSPFTIPTRSEHERDLASGKSQVVNIGIKLLIFWQLLC